MADEIEIGDRVQVFLNARVWGQDAWFDGTVVGIDPYSDHRSFFWVQLDDPPNTKPGGTRLISVLNPRNIRKA